MSKDINKIEKSSADILIEPCITEATTAMAGMNKYVFKVKKDSSKPEVKKTVEKIYGVNVVSVKTINIPAKVRLRGKTKGLKSGFKKAIVTLKDGNSIDFFGNK